MRRTSLLVLIAAAGLWVAWAAKLAILHPEMTVESGSYDKPMATIESIATNGSVGKMLSKQAAKLG